jgi:hypothetical protein
MVIGDAGTLESAGRRLKFEIVDLVGRRWKSDPDSSP